MTCAECREQLLVLDLAEIEALPHLQACTECRAFAEAIRALDHALAEELEDFADGGDFDAAWAAATAAAAAGAEAGDAEASTAAELAAASPAQPEGEAPSAPVPLRDRRRRWIVGLAPLLAAAIALLALIPVWTVQQGAVHLPPPMPSGEPLAPVVAEPEPEPEAEPEVAVEPEPAPVRAAPRPRPRPRPRPAPEPAPAPVPRLAASAPLVLSLPAEVEGRVDAECPSAKRSAAIVDGRATLSLPAGEVCIVTAPGLPPVAVEDRSALRWEGGSWTSE